MESITENNGREPRNWAKGVLKRGFAAVIVFAIISLYIIFTNDSPDRTPHMVLFIILYINVFMMIIGYYYFAIRIDEKTIPKVVLGMHLGGFMGSTATSYIILRGFSSSPEVAEYAPTYYVLGFMHIIVLLLYWTLIRQESKKA